MYDSYFFPYLIPLCGCSLPLCPPPPPAREEEEEDESCALLLRSMFTRSMYSARASVAIWRGTKKKENRLQEIRGSSVLRSNNCILMQGTTISRPKKGLGGSCVLKVGKMYVESPAKFASQIYRPYSFSS